LLEVGLQERLLQIAGPLRQRRGESGHDRPHGGVISKPAS
jgi:hypothetical protein